MPAHRCAKCGRLINTETCFGCSVESKRDKAKEIRKTIEGAKRAGRKISEESCDQSIVIERAAKKQSSI